MGDDLRRIPKHMGRVEFIACRETVQAMAAQGYDNKTIHAQLTEQGRITMSYSSFCMYMARLRAHEEALLEADSHSSSFPLRKQDDPNPTRHAEPSRLGRVGSQGSERSHFTITPSPRKEDLF